MAQKDWKFHDYSMGFNTLVKEYKEARRYPVVYALTNLLPGSLCLVYGSGDPHARWYRKTKNEGKGGSTRYHFHSNLDEALEAGIKWARRKDEEEAKELAEIRVRLAEREAKKAALQQGKSA